MRLIFDSKSNNLFLSCHYSMPALITASGAGSAESVSLAAILKGLKKTHKNLKNYSEGVNFGPGMNTRHLEAIARADPPFKAWLPSELKIIEATEGHEARAQEESQSDSRNSGFDPLHED